MRNSLKSIKITAFVLLVIALHSCLKDSEEYYPIQIGTVQVIDKNSENTSFLLDSSYMLYPKNPENIAHLKLKQNDRVFIQFSDLSQDESKKELHATIKYIDLIPTKSIEQTENENSAMELIDKSDKINITDAYITNGFITFKYTYQGGQKRPEEHHISMFSTTEIDQNSGVLKLYLTHDSQGDFGTNTISEVITLPVNSIEEQLTQVKEVKIISKTIIQGVIEHDVYLKNKNK